jgi:hypothetical protein
MPEENVVHIIKQGHSVNKLWVKMAILGIDIINFGVGVTRFGQIILTRRYCGLSQV